MAHHLPIDGEQVAHTAEENRSYNGRLRIGIPEKDSEPTTRIVPDVTQPDCAYAMAMVGQRFEDITRKEGVRVAKLEWGVRRVCQSCASKCYGLGHSPIACPQCGTHFDPEAPLK